ncbi:ABC transporter ATP-binding protein/permease [Tessaracoccus lacteus]|uniref:ABC transporter ATP-binding protein/permease n=1 Tax=Tessaracoccus lacteus TaxID=3041766 RepID=A0ABY8PZR9_9ACTN|nr:ABC transporter ATP-binding protein/permease [Tessaracoccus sp. T21]WGT47907.1 ABC transporter ATP-binding protein/permease [Tessaracoccus sp. T21]
MLELRDVRKTYTTGDFTQVALNDVSIAFRDSEFVAVLGPSGSGKTTMLNIVGGLDHYDSGNLIIDGIETSSYRDRDWDAYRNNRIGFVFQSYNLIPHQSVLANVELALTLAGVSRAERRRRATAALQDVGLGDHIHKRPSQLSGGQMQRVAIARALVNDPEILLADEPTGALDSTTSVQIMGLLTSIARDRLVVMVTHNPELAEEYATRIVSLKDGVIASDTDPFVPQAVEREGRKARRTAMSFPTAISLSFNNLMTKKGRTLMTSFAGSIGIIGIASILALANGVNAYIKGVEEDTLSLYPLSIQRQGVDLTSLLTASRGIAQEASAAGDADDGDVHEVQLMASMFGSVGTNDLRSLKSFLDGNGGGIDDYVNSIQYSYDVSPRIYASDTSDGVRQVNPDTTFSSLGFGSSASASSLLSSSSSTSVFSELVDDLSLVENNAEIVAGRWPTAYDEVALVLTGSGGVSDLTLYAMGLRDPQELDDMVKQVATEGDVTVPDDPGTYSYQDLMGVSFKAVDSADLYSYDDEFDVWTDRSDDTDYVTDLVDDGDELRVVGVVQPSGDSSTLQPGIYYTRDLTEHMIADATDSAIVQSQLADPDVDVFTGKEFGAEDDGEEADLSSLFTIDEDALAGAFTFDQSKLQLDTSALESELSNLDLGLDDVQLDPSKLPALDVADILSQLDLSSVIKLPEAEDDGEATPSAPQVDTEALTAAVTAFAEAYTQWATAAGLDPTDPATLPAFLASAEGQAALAAGGEELDSEAAQQLLAAYLAYAVANGADPTDVAATMPAFLASPEGQALLASLTPDTTDADDAAQAADDSLAGRLVQGYLAYAEANNLDPQDIGTNLPAFLATDEGAALLAEAGTYVDTDALSAQLQPMLGDYVDQVVAVYSADLSSQLGAALSSQIGSALESSMASLADNMSSAMGINEDAFLDAFQLNRSTEELTRLLVSMAKTEAASLEGNLRTLGYADLDNPSNIDIYPIDFESKAEVINILDTYNDDARDAGDDDRVVTYTDIVGALMTSVTDIINTISYVLIAFVAISLVVSSIMIGVITYISVLERKKEIGILRSVGARKRDIRTVFNAETLIVGFVAGALGVAITALMTIPANAIVAANFGVENVAVLPWQAAIILVLISMGLTSVAGLMPASTASRKDPVEALRSE